MGKKMLTVQDEAVETLTGLGLTMLQAKVYLALAKNGESTVKEIAKNSKVARQDLYRITPELLNIGLIEKLIYTPIKFKAIPVQEAIDILLERRKKEITTLELKSKDILKSFRENEFRKSRESEDHFIIINDLHARLIKAKKQFETTKQTVEIITKWSFFLTYTLEVMDELAKALSRGTTVKIVTQRPEHFKSLPNDLKKIMNHSGFEIRYVSHLPSSIVAVFDKEEVNISLSSEKTPMESGMLVSNNLSLVELSHNYFEIMWMNALKEQPQ
jgi:sugar-specific transcriptional regulator TrmB